MIPAARLRLEPALILALVVTLACAADAIPGTEVGGESSPSNPGAAGASPASAATGTAPSSDRLITVAAVGDLMLARDVATQMATEGALHPFERVLPLFAGVDLLIGNLEGTFTDRGEPLEKRYTFRTPPALASGLADAGFDAVSLANNHSFDFGAVGLTDTLAALEAVGVAAFGAGTDQPAASAPVTFEVDGQTVALLGFNAIGGTRVATAAQSGVAWADADAVTAVGAAAALADHVIVMVHAGVEYSSEPTEAQTTFARSVIDAGADVVVGHHPHTLQPAESYADGLILSSLGNFVFDLDAEDLQTLGRGPFESVVALLELSRDERPRVSFRPVMIDVGENRPRPATAEETPAIVERIGTHWPWEPFVSREVQPRGWVTSARRLRVPARTNGSIVDDRSGALPSWPARHGPR